MNISEIAPDVYRLSLYVPEGDMQFNQFLVKDEEPLLFHTGMKAIFPLVQEAVSKIINPSEIRHISFSHFEADECGSLNEWLEIAPNAIAICSFVGAVVSVNDFAIRPALALENGETFSTGKYTFKFVHTPHLPHCWEAGMLFEETNRTLFCSDLFHQLGDVEAQTENDIVGRAKNTLVNYQTGPFANYMPYTSLTEANFEKLISLQPKTLAVMHGSTFIGNGSEALRDFSAMMKEVLD